MITESEVTLEFIRSSGPGGQNVNKVSSKVRLRFDYQASPSLSEPQKARLAHSAIIQGLLNKEGEIIITCQEERSQERNRALALKKLNDAIKKALTPRKKRRKTSVPRAVKEKRLSDKKVKSERKKFRRNFIA